MTAGDLSALITWQNGLAPSPTTANGVMIEWAFVGGGASGIYSPDDLTAAVIADQGQFRWVNHSYDHRVSIHPLRRRRSKRTGADDHVSTNLRR